MLDEVPASADYQNSVLKQRFLGVPDGYLLCVSSQG